MRWQRLYVEREPGGLLQGRDRSHLALAGSMDELQSMHLRYGSSPIRGGQPLPRRVERQAIPSDFDDLGAVASKFGFLSSCSICAR